MHVMYMHASLRALHMHMYMNMHVMYMHASLRATHMHCTCTHMHMHMLCMHASHLAILTPARPCT